MCVCVCVCLEGGGICVKGCKLGRRAQQSYQYQQCERINPGVRLCRWAAGFLTHKESSPNYRLVLTNHQLSHAIQ